MVHSFQRGWRPGRVTSFVVGALLVGGLLLAAVPTRSAETPAKKEPTKKEVKRTLPPPPWPRPLDLVIAGKDQQHNAEVADTVKFINQQLEATWKADKVVPSRYADDHEFIRRVSLDIIGRIATPKEIEQFLRDPDDQTAVHADRAAAGRQGRRILEALGEHMEQLAARSHRRLRPRRLSRRVERLAGRPIRLRTRPSTRS